MSDDNGQTWNGPASLHGAMHPGTDAGYDDLKRTVDGTFEAVTSFATLGGCSGRYHRKNMGRRAHH